ncbi:chloroplast protein Ycf34-domain-containing protein [Pelagophyceae sp. CCMP2097]|nr:chloroplast protein Ycf34-domain-containing protein [Pelagophyceae sp. CCMP2097]
MRTYPRSLFLLAVVVLLPSYRALSRLPSSRALRPGFGAARRFCVAPPGMCICVDCALVDRCTAYHVVEAKHDQPHVSPAPDFTPRSGSPTVAINLFEGAAAAADEADGARVTIGARTTVELDVTHCADFLFEAGRWAKMMPTGTLLAAGLAADFVPS